MSVICVSFDYCKNSSTFIYSVTIIISLNLFLNVHTYIYYVINFIGYIWSVKNVLSIANNLVINNIFFSNIK